MIHAFSESNSIALGPHRLPNRVLLAPMASITDLPFRKVAARFGAGLVVSEMIASEWLAEGDATAALRAEGEGVGLNVVQLAGCEARWLAEGARVAEAAGADIIDINMGCPAKHVTSGQAGAALLRDLDHATKLIETTIDAVRIPVTLKMRLGWDENSIVAPELARRARGRRRRHDHGARPHALPVLSGPCRLERDRARESRGQHSRGRQWRSANLR